MTSGADPFEQLVARGWPPADWADVTTLVAVSGGPDSVALLRALVALKQPGRGRLLVAHFNHGWRGAESDEDARFVMQLAGELGTPFHLGNACDAVGTGLARSEQAARDARYAFLLETAHQQAARYVALAHTADDQAETVLHRLVRGTGVAGLAGMTFCRPLSLAATLVRPLLRCRRDDVLAYLERLGQPYRIDASNADPRYTRNRLRHGLMAELARDYNPRVVEALVRLARQAAEWRELLQPQLEQLFAAAVVSESAVRVVLRRPPLSAAPLPLLRELLVQVWRRQAWPERSMTADHWQSLAEWIVAPAAEGVLQLPDGLVAYRGFDEIELRRSSI
ncbi:MAG: tRNA lysidine(34) synthetase TilS [Pirellulales bacterium]